MIAMWVLSFGGLASTVGASASATPATATRGDAQRTYVTAVGHVDVPMGSAGSSSESLLMPAADGRPVPVDGIPVALRSSYKDAYTFVRQCQSRRQFEAFVESSRLDPDSLQSHPEKIMPHDPGPRARYLDRPAMLENRRQECADWETTVPTDKAYEQLYLTALENALAGDQVAAACFVVRTWPMPSKNSPEYQRVVSAYHENSKRLIDSGISNGSWPVVRATAAALSSNHAVDSLLLIDGRMAHLVSRLMQLGSGDNALAATYGRDAAQFAAKIAIPMELLSLENEVRLRFETSFHGSYAEMTPFTTLCD